MADGVGSTGGVEGSSGKWGKREREGRQPARKWHGDMGRMVAGFGGKEWGKWAQDGREVEERGGIWAHAREKRGEA
uniref:Uncharacterized protein n=1 Tax=Oryza sativa subsp. japonica TaxID=39947 RepID=Q8H4T9_ORYSJ|nr:hypothetical protein [Oryza sativa Japonica Group]